MQFEIRQMSRDLVGDFYQIHCEKNGEGWCNCVAWWVPNWDGWTKRSAEINKKLRDELFEKGEFDGYLLYVDGKPVCWSQCGPRDRLPNLQQVYQLTPDPEVWGITCFVIPPPYRGKGLAHWFLKEMLRDLKLRAVRHVQAFPKRGEHLEPGQLWRGPEQIYIKANFTIERNDEKQPIYGKWL